MSHGILQARIMEWVAFPFSREFSWPRNQTRISCIAGGFSTGWATREAPSGRIATCCSTVSKVRDMSLPGPSYFSYVYNSLLHLSWLIPDLRCVHCDSPARVCNEFYTASSPYRSPQRASTDTIRSSVSRGPGSSRDLNAESVPSRSLGQSWQPSVSLDRCVRAVSQVWNKYAASRTERGQASVVFPFWWWMMQDAIICLLLSEDVLAGFRPPDPYQFTTVAGP